MTILIFEKLIGPNKVMIPVSNIAYISEEISSEGAAYSMIHFKFGGGSLGVKGDFSATKATMQKAIMDK